MGVFFLTIPRGVWYNIGTKVEGTQKNQAPTKGETI